MYDNISELLKGAFEADGTIEGKIDFFTDRDVLSFPKADFYDEIMLVSSRKYGLYVDGADEYLDIIYEEAENRKRYLPRKNEVWILKSQIHYQVDEDDYSQFIQSIDHILILKDARLKHGELYCRFDICKPSLYPLEIRDLCTEYSDFQKHLEEDA